MSAMLGIFKRTPSETPERAAKRDAIDQMVQYAQEQADDLITGLRRRREREQRLLRNALKDGTNGG